MDIRFTIQTCWLGWVLIAATPQGICTISLGDSPDTLTEELHDRFPKANFHADDPTLDAWVEEVLAFVEVPQLELDLPLDLQGTAFQQEVWQALQTIPPGHTATYSEIATSLGQPNAVRAIGQACSANPVAVAVPCHRVIGKNGELGDYRWGRDRKQALLQREARVQALMSA
jgi:AraC family transcriptional regulator of adaptative response/methylated-DNA-[protein]-cysteine methyltransferase